MKSGQIYLAPSIPDLSHVGARELEDFFRPTPSLDGARATLLRSREGVEVWRLSIARARASGASAVLGATTVLGTTSALEGQVLLTRFLRSPWSDLWRARFTHPRSQSLAEREWNLLCHLRASGVSTAEPLAVGRAGDGLFTGRSFLVTRELTGMRGLSEWLAEKLDVRAKAHIARAVGLCVDRVARSRTFLPELTPEAIAVGVPRILIAGAPTCGDEPHGGRFGKLPEVALLDVRGGRVTSELSIDVRLAMLRVLFTWLAARDRRFALRVLLVSLPRRGDASARARRRDHLRRFLRTTAPHADLASS